MDAILHGWVHPWYSRSLYQRYTVHERALYFNSTFSLGLALYSGSVGGACINNFTFFLSLQVQRTCLALDGLGFSHISTVEVLRREYTEHSIRYKTFESRDDRVQARKRRRLNEDGGDEKDGKDDKDEKEADDEDDAEEAYVETEKEAERFTIPLPTSRGHSAYLTFAHKTPL